MEEPTCCPECGSIGVDSQIPVFVKNSIVRELGEQYRIQEFPK